MIISTFSIAPLPKQRNEVLEILKSVQGPIAAQPGCLSCNIYAEVGSGSSILFSEHWESEAALHKHVRSSLYLRILAAVEFSNSAPEVWFHRVAESEDMKLIWQVRAEDEHWKNE